MKNTDNHEAAEQVHDRDERAATPWSAVKGGTTLGTTGSEGGLILRDEEHSAGARITLERDGWTPFGITCGIYGCFMHTAFADTEIQATTMYEAMKLRLGELVSCEGDIVGELEAFTNQF